MLIEADKGLLLVVTPRNLYDLPLVDIYQRAQENKWVLAIVHSPLETRFRELYGSLPWDQAWYVDLSNGHDLEKALAEAQVKARTKKVPQLIRLWREERSYWPAEIKEIPPLEPRPKPKRRTIQARWKAAPDISWYDEPVKGLRRKVRKMLKSSL